MEESNIRLLTGDAATNAAGDILEGKCEIVGVVGQRQSNVKPFLVSPVDEYAGAVRDQWLNNPGYVLQSFVHGGLLHPEAYKDVYNEANIAIARHKKVRKRIMQAASMVPQMPTASGFVQRGQQTPNNWNLPATSGSRQLNIEDLYQSLDFIPPPAGIAFEIYETTIFEDDHIDGSILQRIATAFTRLGWETRKFEQNTSASSDSGNDDNERKLLNDWVNNLNLTNPFRRIMQLSAVAYMGMDNSWLEVIPDEDGPQQMPAGMEWAMTSPMRILRGHRGYVQFLAGQFRWFNVYLWNQEDRRQGTIIWEDYWKEREIDPYSEDFLASPMCRMMTSGMPEGAWNPFLSSMIHLRGLSLSSKYYGFPRAARSGGLHALLDNTLDYNISLQRNNEVPPYVVQFRGELDDKGRADIENYLKTLQGPNNWGIIPVFKAPLAKIGGPGDAKSGIEFIQIGQPIKDGIFQQLWTQVKKDKAFIYGYPYDLMTTENSNRSTIEVARDLLNEDVIWDVQDVHEEPLTHITRDHMGLTRRYIGFVRGETGDRLQRAQEFATYHDRGALSANEGRTKFLSIQARDADGDKFYHMSTVLPEGEEAMGTQLEPTANTQQIQKATKTPAGEGAKASSNGQKQ